jgi:hypothetical protein
MLVAPHHPRPTSAPRGAWWAPTPGSFQQISLACPHCGHTITLRDRNDLRREDRVTTIGIACDVICSWVGCTASLGSVRLDNWPTARKSAISLEKPVLVPHPRQPASARLAAC